MSSESEHQVTFEYENREIYFSVTEKNEKAIEQQQKGVQVDIEVTCFPRLFLEIPFEDQEKLEKPHHGCTEVAIVYMDEVFNSVTFKPRQFSNFKKFRRILYDQVVKNWPFSTPWYIIFMKKFWYKLWPIANRMSPNHNLLSLKVKVGVTGTHYLVKSSVFHRLIQNSLHDSDGVVPAVPDYVQVLFTERIEEDDYNNVNVKEEKGSCSICLDEFSKGCEVMLMPCRHMFHTKCIQQWLSKSYYCPLCHWKMPIFFACSDRLLVGVQHKLTWLAWNGLSFS